MQIERFDIKSKASICEIIAPLAFLVLYLTYLHDISGKPFFRYLVVNPLVYDSEAKQILQGIPSSQPFFLSPLYPGWLASIYFLTNSSRMAVALINGIFGALAIHLVGAIAKQVLGKRASCIASIMTACYWSLYYFCGELMPTVLCISAVLASTYCALDKKPSPMRVPLIILGLLSLGFISHLYPGFKASGAELHYHAGKPIANLAFSLVFMVGVALVLLTIFSRRSLGHIRCYSIGGTLAGLSLLLWSGTAPYTLLLTVYLIIRRAERFAIIAWLTGLSIPIAASTYHNYAITGQVIPLTTSFGVNLFIGNNPTSDGINPFKFGEGNQVRIEADRQGLSGKARSDFFKQKAIEFIKNNKRDWIGLLGRKALISLTRLEISNNADISERRQCWRLRQLAFVNFGLILPLASIGFLLAIKKSEGAWLLFSGYLSFMLTQVILFSCERFRVPGATLLIPLAGYGLVGFIEEARKPPKNLIKLATVAGLMAFVSNYDFLSLSKTEFSAIVANKAYVERLNGNFEKASQLARRAIQMEPTSASAYFQLGAIEEHFGNLDKSLDYYLISLRNDPFFVASYNGARRILESLKISPGYLDAYVDQIITRKDSEQTKIMIENFVKERLRQAKQR